MNQRRSRDQQFSNNGWTRRFVAAEPRLSEAVQAYEEAGFEIRLQTLSAEQYGNWGDEEDDNRCRNCFDGQKDEYRIIYTRPKPSGEDDPF